MGRDGRGVAFRALERRHMGRRRSLRVRRNVVVGDLELAHGHTSDYFGLTLAHRAWVFQTMIFRSCGRALRLPRKRRALSTWRMSSRRPNVRVWPAATAPDIGLEWCLRGTVGLWRSRQTARPP